MATESATGKAPLPATLDDLLDSASRARPDAVAVRCGGQVLAYGELHARVRATARRWDSLGLTQHGTAALLLENTPECVVAFLAAARLGVRLIPLEPGTTRPQLAALRAATGRLFVAAHEARLRALGGGEKQDALGGGEEEDPLDDCVLVSVDEPAGAADEPGRRGPARKPDDDEPRTAAPDAPFLYQYTSGSTGEPKAVVHTQRNLVNGGGIYTRAYGVTGDDRVLVAVPLLHSFGMVAGLVTALRAGAQLVLLGRFTPARLLSALDEHACTVLVAAPMAYDLTTRAAAASRPPRPPGALRLCLSSGAALPPAVAQRARERLGLDVRQVYGCTEAGVIAAHRPEDGPGADRGVGRPLPGVQVRVVDDHGREVPRGGEGALLVRTPAMFTHYLGHPEATRRAFRDGWYATGDVARIGPEGHLHLVGRKDSFINVGGKKVNPLEVERVLLAHPSVAEAVVWGEETGDTGERVRATVVAVTPLPAAELTSHCRARLLSHQVPTAVDFVSALPKNSMGKVRRAAVRAAPDGDGDGG
ncbi:putative acyl-CoA synthetase [Streptomyces ambofaciens ATCC 23877]|uniref:Putative acyl-CoA synthetase n=1 Tax=Streptomyces ambofaciens (strain ATCC 23877 / 3486 / DSM 40053 / JCM 4204 / NBRC 12836 / NRRL B-2516) TaxID=278992 RepID=A0ADS3_STRA7|nr:class I adenylate-forming enzyme family protein [Streptomyces ambofaciens]AKZ59699.1 putative acyl-CoA synthetase [Streptomyces ambofaciens ATCC 23877]CAJ88630.1 putative acyl-CoA synthetase [Streptomyces ambofaciens ATCC 23877]